MYDKMVKDMLQKVATLEGKWEVSWKMMKSFLVKYMLGTAILLTNVAQGKEGLIKNDITSLSTLWN